MTIDEARFLAAVVTGSRLVDQAKRVGTLPPFWTRERGIWQPNGRRERSRTYKETTMRKALGIVIGALLFVALPCAAQMAGSVVSLNAASSNTAGTDATFSAYPSVMVHVFGASCVGTVAIEAGSKLDHYEIVAQVLNPGTGGEWYAGPSAPFVRCRVLDDYVSGTASCIIIASSNATLSHSWKKLTAADGLALPTATPTSTPTATPTGTRTPTATPTRTPTPRP